MSSEKQSDTSLSAHTSAAEPNNPSHDVEYPVALVKAGTEWGVWSRRTETFTNLSQVTAFKKSELPHALHRLELRLPMSQEIASLRDKLFSAVCLSEDCIPDYVGWEQID